MKKGMLFGLIIGIALMGAVYAIPALAHGPSTSSGGGNAADNPITGDVWDQMWDACQSGDWEAMNQIHSQFWGDETTAPAGNTNTAPNQSSNSFWDEMHDYMGGGMMGGSGSGWGGMMGGGMMGGGSGFGGMMGW